MGVKHVAIESLPSPQVLPPQVLPSQVLPPQVLPPQVPASGLPVESAKSARRGRSSKKTTTPKTIEKRTIDKNLTEATLANLNGAEPIEVNTPVGKSRRAVPSPKPPATQTRCLTKPLPSSNAPAVWTAPSSQVLEQIKDFRQQLEAMQTQIATMNQQSAALDTNLGELRKLSQQMQSLAKSHAAQQAKSTQSPAPHPRLDDWGSQVPASSENSGGPESQPAVKPSFVSRSQPIAPYSTSAHATKAVKPSLIVTTSQRQSPAIEPQPSPATASTHSAGTPPAKPSFIHLSQSHPSQSSPSQSHSSQSPSQSSPPTLAQPGPQSQPQSRPQSRPQPAAKPTAQSISQVAPAPVSPNPASPSPRSARIRRPPSSTQAHGMPSPPLRLRLQALLPIPQNPVTIAIDAMLWTLTATGVRLGIQGVIVWIPSLAVPLTLVMLLPAIVAAYLAFFVPQSSTTVIYRLLLITLGLFLGSKV